MSVGSRWWPLGHQTTTGSYRSLGEFAQAFLHWASSSTSGASTEHQKRTRSLSLFCGSPAVRPESTLAAAVSHPAKERRALALCCTELRQHKPPFEGGSDSSVCIRKLSGHSLLPRCPPSGSHCRWTCPNLGFALFLKRLTKCSLYTLAASGGGLLRDYCGNKVLESRPTSSWNRGPLLPCTRKESDAG